MLRIAAPVATKKAAQDAPRATIGTSGDLQVHSISSSLMLTGGFTVSTVLGRVRAIEEGVDADVPVDAQNAPTSDLENCRQFSTAPTPIIFPLEEEEERRANDKNSATQLSTKSDQVQARKQHAYGYAYREARPATHAIGEARPPIRGGRGTALGQRVRT
jgi:hypothetical protein